MKALAVIREYIAYQMVLCAMRLHPPLVDHLALPTIAAITASTEPAP